MKREEIDQRKARLKQLLREYRGLVGDGDKAIREWAKSLAAENQAFADSYLLLLDHPEDALGEARFDAAQATAKVHRMEAEQRMRTAMQAHDDKRRELDDALEGFAAQARNDLEEAE